MSAVLGSSGPGDGGGGGGAPSGMEGSAAYMSMLRIMGNMAEYHDIMSFQQPEIDYTFLESLLQ